METVWRQATSTSLIGFELSRLNRRKPYPTGLPQFSSELDLGNSERTARSPPRQELMASQPHEAKPGEYGSIKQVGSLVTLPGRKAGMGRQACPPESGP
jgi:hypothetical protein